MEYTVPRETAGHAQPRANGCGKVRYGISSRDVCRYGVWAFAVVVFASLVGCASIPPGSNYPKVSSVTLSDPDTTRFGQHFAKASSENPGHSGFRIFNVGVDGLLIRLEMVNAAERTLDLEYYVFHGDESGRLLTDALVRAADRGVRVRVLVDDAETIPGDEQLLTLSGHAGIEIRVFNPWTYRGHNKILRDAEFLLRHSQLDYRMHNKMLLADGSVALAGGRNVGDQYFQIDPESQFADDDVFAAGPITRNMSKKFDEFWNSDMAIPAEALTHRDPKSLAASSARLFATARARKIETAGFNYDEKLATGQPLAGILSGELPLVWADAQFVSDVPDKKSAVDGARVGGLMYRPLAKLATDTKSELIVVTPFFVPTKSEMQLLETRRQQQVRVRVLTNSLQSNPSVAAHAGYMHYRVKLLQDGVQINEVRPLLGNTRGSGQSKRISRFGNFALHAKVYILDRKELYMGSMNFDARSKHLNTEMGFIIDSAKLSEQEVARFEAMTRPENSYVLSLSPASGASSPHLIWHTLEDGKAVDYTTEPARRAWRRWQAKFIACLPLDPEL